MKRIVLILIAFLVLLGFSACANESVESEVEELEEIVTYYYYKPLNYIDESRVGSTKRVKWFGSLALPYKESTKDQYKKYPVHKYEDGDLSYTFDHNNQLMALSFAKAKFPEGYYEKTIKNTRGCSQANLP